MCSEVVDRGGLHLYLFSAYCSACDSVHTSKCEQILIGRKGEKTIRKAGKLPSECFLTNDSGEGFE